MEKLEVLGYKDALEILNRRSGDVQLGMMLDRIIEIKHYDRSVLKFHSAYCEEICHRWYGIFTEHHGNFVYFDDDIEYIKQMFAEEYIYI